MNLKYCLLILILIGGMIPGCNKKQRPEGLPELYPFAIKVIQDGQPLAGANISLVAQDPALMRWPCGGNTNEEGIVKLTTYGFEGVPAGQFKVLIMKTETIGGVHNAEEAKRQREGEDFGKEEIFNLIDPIYRDQSTSPFVIDVKASYDNPISEFDVGEAVKVPIKMPGE
ncbi:MAG: carboxypeptidase-like regulatory domain-containing protein [Planctomycetia bacterium]|nr:carboxypeptidase-like regulatory domain-containing protein [Planctomycetia bacterium]